MDIAEQVDVLVCSELRDGWNEVRHQDVSGIDEHGARVGVDDNIILDILFCGKCVVERSPGVRLENGAWVDVKGEEDCGREDHLENRWKTVTFENLKCLT